MDESMSDDIDRAQNEVERSLGEALRSRKVSGPSPTGRCLYCDDITGDEQRWCDAGCRDAWQDLPTHLR
jgi:hypothetical protein